MVKNIKFNLIPSASCQLFLLFQSSQWKWLTQINKELFDKDPFLVAFDCFSVFAETKGILVVISDGEVINIKFSVTGDPSRPLKCEDMARIKEFNGEFSLFRHPTAALTAGS